MLIYMHKKRMAPGNQALSCMAANADGYIGIVQDGEITLTKLKNEWEFIYPNTVGPEKIEDLSIVACAGPPIPDKPYCVYENDYTFKVSVDLFP